MDDQIMLFQSVRHVMRALNLLQMGGLSPKVIPVPKAFSSECGMCLLIARVEYPVACRLLDAGQMVYQCPESE